MTRHAYLLWLKVFVQRIPSRCCIRDGHMRTREFTERHRLRTRLRHATRRPYVRRLTRLEMHWTGCTRALCPALLAAATAETLNRPVRRRRWRLRRRCCECTQWAGPPFPRQSSTELVSVYAQTRARAPARQSAARDAATADIVSLPAARLPPARVESSSVIGFHSINHCSSSLPGSFSCR